MTESDWTVCDDPRRMLELFRRTDSYPVTPPFRVLSDRKLRQFACACCRQVWDGVPCERCRDSLLGIGKRHLCESQLDDTCPDCRGTGRVGGLTDPRSRLAVEVAERMADEGKSEDDEEFREVIDEADVADGYPGFRIPTWAAEAAVGLTAAGAAQTAITHSGVPPVLQAAILRDLIGNPFRPVAFDPSWRTRTVLTLAQLIYDNRDFALLPVLADALEDAGCEDVGVLNHCRGMERAPEGWYHCRSCGKYWRPVHKYDDCDGGAVCEGMAESVEWIPLRCGHGKGCLVLDLALGKS